MAEKVRKGPEKDMAHLTQALCNLKKGDYPACADSFLKIKSLTDDKYNEILSDNDVATYGTLCALAVLDPKRLKAKTLGSSSFRSFLELTPKLRRAVSAFCTGRFANCMSILEGLKNDYLLDIYLSDQVDELFTVIRKKCIKQYCLPFSVVKLKTLSDAFGVDGASVEEELIALIKSGEIDARIDLIEGVSFRYSPCPDY